MKIVRLILIGLTSLFFSCSQSTEKQSDNKLKEHDSMPEKSLLEQVRLAINPKFQDWVLFENGTYIIFDNVDTVSNVENEAIKQMKEFGHVYTGGPAGDFSVTHLNQTEGWVVSGHGYGMYTYVNPKELESTSPTDVEIGIHGRTNRNQDGQRRKIIHVNKKEK